ncbi:type I 3-dehydroquinate dehydratase, partial [Acidobacteriota bacterium]
ADIFIVKTLLNTAASAHRALIAFSMGPHGCPTRCLAPVWGSHAVYASTGAGKESAPGQLAARDLVKRYRYKALSPESGVITVIGKSDKILEVPGLYNAIFDLADLDALCIPAGQVSMDELGTLASGIPLKGVLLEETEASRGQERLDRNRDLVVIKAGAQDLMKDAGKHVQRLFGIEVAEDLIKEASSRV